MAERLRDCTVDTEERRYALDLLEKNSAFCASQSLVSVFRSSGTL